MPISVPCTGCGKVLQVRDSAAGIRAQCSHCGDMIQVPKLKSRPAIGDFDEEPAPAAKVTYEPTPHNGFKLAGEDRCLECCKTIKTGLLRCPYCGVKIAPPPRKHWWRRSENWWSNPQEQDLTLEDIALCIVAAPLMLMVGVARKCRGHRTANSILILSSTGLVVYLAAIIAFQIWGPGQKLSPF